MCESSSSQSSLERFDEGTLSSVTSLLSQKCEYPVGPNEL